MTELLAVAPGSPAEPALPRVDAALEACIGYEPGAGRSVLRRLYQQGSARLRFPHGLPGRIEAAIINTAGGLTGGDRWRAAFTVEAEAALTVTTPACERIYRSLSGSATISTSLVIGPAARFDWLPQETILFDRASLDRTLTIEMAEDATLLAVEPVIFGRTAMGERVRNLTLADRWRLRRGGRLLYADSLIFAGPTEELFAGKAGLAGCVAIATLLLVAPDAESRLDAVRGQLADCAAQAGASAWDGMLAVRLAASDGARLRAALVPLLMLLRPEKTLPRLWSC